jgi:ParB/RepB/Spo0J family partition protein
MPTTSAKNETKGSKGRARGAQAPEGAPAGAPKVETDGDKVIVAGVDVSEAGAIPTGIPLNDGEGSVFLVVEPGMLMQDPEVDPGRDPEDYAADNEDMQELVASMRAHAAAHPLAVGNHTNIILRRGPNGELWVVAGRRRHAGAGYAGTKLAAILRPNMTTAQATVTAITENGQRTGASALGEARQFAELRDRHGMKVAAIVEATGKQQAYVSRRLALLSLPAWAQAMLRTGKLTEGTAYEGMAKFAAVPEPAHSEMWATLARRWPQMEKEPGGITAARLRHNLGEIARNLSRSLDPSTYYRGETPPVFDLAAHDAACACGRPKLGISDNGIQPHARCYDVAVWDGLQKDAKAARTKALQTRTRGGKADAQPNEAEGTASEAETTGEAERVTGEAESPASSSTPTSATTEKKPAPRPRVPPRYTCPAWDEVEEAFGGSTAARETVLTLDHTADEIKSAAPSVVLDVSALPVDAVQIVQGPQPGLFRVICTDVDALKAALAAGAKAVEVRTEQIRQQDRAAFREAAGKVELRSPEVLAALVLGFGNAPSGFGAVTADRLGLGDFKNAKPAKVAELPKKDLSLWLQGVAYRWMKQDTGYTSYDPTPEQARAQIAAEAAEDFRAMLAAVPGPELTNAGRLQVRAGTIVALMDGVRELVSHHDDTQDAGAFSDELGEYAPTWAEGVEAFRAECNALASEGVAYEIDLDAIGNPHGEGSLADLIGEAAALLQHPVFARIAAEAAKQARHAEQEDGEGAHASAPEAEPVAEAQEDGEGAQAPAPEAEPVAEAQEDGEGAQVPAPEAEPVAEAQEDGEGAQVPAPEAEPVADAQDAGVAEAEPVAEAQPAPKGRGARRGGKARK